MSYCRFAWDGSDVYVYGSDRGLECCGCALDEEETVFAEPEDMIAHLARHRRAGHFVPEHAITGLWADIPGATRPVYGEPPPMTHARLQSQMWRLEKAVKEAEDRAKDYHAQRWESPPAVDAVDPADGDSNQ